MNNLRQWLRIVGLCLMALPAATAVHAQADSYPNKTVTIISDAAPGSTPDVDARFVAEGLSKSVRAAIHRGQSSRRQRQHRRSRRHGRHPDGYTLFMPALSTFVALPSIAPNLPLHAAARFYPDRIHGRKSDVRRGQPQARRRHTAATHRAGEEGAGKNLDCGDRRRQAYRSHRPVAARSRRRAAVARPLHRRTGSGARRRRIWPRVDDHRRLFGNRRRGEGRPGQADRGGVA